MRQRQYTAERNPGQFLIDNVTAQGHVVPESEHQLDFPLVEEIQKGAVRDQAQKRMKGRIRFRQTLRISDKRSRYASFSQPMDNT